MARAFNELTGPGRMRRLRPLAVAALANWDVRPLSVRPLAQSVNAMFCVDAADGQRYVLRVFQAGQKRMDDRLVEAHWTRALAAVANVPEPIPARDGSFLVTEQAKDVPQPRVCALSRYVPGKLMRSTPAHYELLGQEMARLLVLLNYCCNRLDWDDIAAWRAGLADRPQRMVTLAAA